ncbi:MAG: hypothetical protein ACYCQJ_15385 [Nitrososphaerales archaeon]
MGQKKTKPLHQHFALAVVTKNSVYLLHQHNYEGLCCEWRGHLATEGKIPSYITLLDKGRLIDITTEDLVSFANTVNIKWDSHSCYLWAIEALKSLDSLGKLGKGEHKVYLTLITSDQAESIIDEEDYLS